MISIPVVTPLEITQRVISIPIIILGIYPERKKQGKNNQQQGDEAGVSG